MDNQSLVIVARHGAFFLLVGTMNKQIQVKYQSTPSSPYDTQKMVTSAFLVALFVYATASLAEVTPRVQESEYLRRLVGNTRLFAGAITAVFLLVLLIPAWGVSVHHGIFALLVDTISKQIQVKYQSTPSSPYDTPKMATSAFLVALFIYATASVAEVTPRIQESVYLSLVGNTRLFAGAFATVFLLVLLIPAWG